MNTRVLAGLAVAGLLVVGVGAWIAEMPSGPNTGTGDPVAQAAAIAEANTAALQGAPPLDTSQSQATATPAAVPHSAMDGVVAPSWLASTAKKTGIPERALEAYAGAAIREKKTDPGCGVAWNTLAAIGTVESGNGSADGAQLGADGEVVGNIYGPELNGQDFTAVPDTDNGALDGDAKWDRAVGPMQFLPATWERDGIDGSGDGKADPNNIDDAALTAASYLCQVGIDLSTGAGWQQAIAGYNDDPQYAEQVRDQANAFAKDVNG